MGGPEDGRTPLGRDAAHLIRKVSLVGDTPEFRVAEVGQRVEVYRGRDPETMIAVTERNLSALLATFDRGVKLPMGDAYEMETVDGSSFVYRYVVPPRGENRQTKQHDLHVQHWRRSGGVGE